MTEPGAAAVRAVTVDLDDTLYPQEVWLAGAWAAVAAEGGRQGLPAEPLRRALVEACAPGSDRGGIVDRALAAVGVPEDAVADLVPGLVRTFAGHRPERLTPYDGVLEALTRLSAAVPVVVVTDGIPAVQHAKVRALGLDDLVTAVVVSDELGGRHLRKPDPAPFRRALELLGQPAGSVVHVGDRPEKDVRGATAIGMRSIRVTTGEYAALPDGPDRPWRTVPTFAEAADLCLAGTGTTAAALRL